MFLQLYLALKTAGLPVSFREYLMLLEGVKANIGAYSVEDFYCLARTALVKHEKYLDLYDRVFSSYFAGLATLPNNFLTEIPADWLMADLLRNLTEEEKAAIESMGGLEALLKRLQELLATQTERHAGGNTWIGTGGTSPFGQGGYNPEGIRIGEEGSSARRGVKAWDKRQYQNLSDDLTPGTRTLKMALRRLRVLTREGLPTELDVKGTIRQTTRNAGVLEVLMHPEKQNRVKVLLLLDVGGSMDAHSRATAELFTAARHEFKHLVQFYFHNCIYDHLWKDNLRRHSERIPTHEVLNTYNRDYKVIIVGDAAMAPSELLAQGGGLEMLSVYAQPEVRTETGLAWLERIRNRYPALVWLNPEPRHYWQMTKTTRVIKDVLGGRMFPLTLGGLSQAVQQLKTPNRKVELG